MEPLISQHHFSNFEVFAEASRDYDLDVKQIDCGAFSTYLQEIQCGPGVITRFSITRRVDVNGNPPPGVWTFGIPTLNCQPFVWRGKQSAGNTIQIYNPSTDLALITHPEFEAIDVSISEQGFDDLNQLWGLPDLSAMTANKEMLNCHPATMHRLRNAHKSICRTAENNPQCFDKGFHQSSSQSKQLQNRIKHQVPYLLAQALMSAEAPGIKATAITRDRAVTTAIDYIQSLRCKDVSTEMICRETGINIRTLQRAFLERYGITPKAYLQSQRLNKAYKVLLDSDPKTTKIKDVALGQGYWHMSQFAADYRRQFGELPSRTLEQYRSDW